MKLIVISPPENVSNEKETIIYLFENGLEVFHVYKPNFSKEEIKKYVQQLPKKYYSKIVLHSDYLKFHSVEELKNCREQYEYAFLSPVFDSISKESYKSNFSLDELEEAVKGKNIIALGGIDEDKIETVREIGFAGVAVLGAIWQSNNPLEQFLIFKEKCQKKDLVF